MRRGHRYGRAPAEPTRIFTDLAQTAARARLDFNRVRPMLPRLRAMLLFVAAATSSKPTVWEKVQAIPMSTWVSLLVALVVIFLLVRVWKSLKEFNEFAPWIALIMVGGSVMLYWTYERTEPKILSPIFDQLSRVLPSKIPYRGHSQ